MDLDSQGLGQPRPVPLGEGDAGDPALRRSARRVAFPLYAPTLAQERRGGQFAASATRAPEKSPLAGGSLAWPRWWGAVTPRPRHLYWMRAPS